MKYKWILNTLSILIFSYTLLFIFFGHYMAFHEFTHVAQISKQRKHITEICIMGLRESDAHEIGWVKYESTESPPPEWEVQAEINGWIFGILITIFLVANLLYYFH